MDRFFKKKRKKSPGRSKQPTPSGKPTKVATGPSNFREEQGVVPKDEVVTLEISNSPDLTATTDNGSSRTDSRTAHHDKALELRTSGLEIGGTGHGDEATSERFRSPALLGAFLRRFLTPRLPGEPGNGSVGARESELAESSRGVSTSRLSRLLFNIDQLQRGPVRAPCSGKLLLTPISKRRLQKDLTPSKLPFGPFPRLYALMIKFDQLSPFNVHCQTYFQGTVAVGNKIEDLLARIIVLERHLDSRPSDVEEQRRREELRRYGV